MVVGTPRAMYNAGWDTGVMPAHCFNTSCSSHNTVISPGNWCATFNQYCVGVIVHATVVHTAQAI